MSVVAACRLPLLPARASTPSAKSAGTGSTGSFSALRVRNTFLHLDSSGGDLESDCSSDSGCRPISDPGCTRGVSPDAAFEEEEGFATDDDFEDMAFGRGSDAAQAARAASGDQDGFVTDDDEDMAFRCERDAAALRLAIAAEEETARLVWREAERVQEQGRQLRALRARAGGEEAVRKRQDLRDRLEAAEHDLEQTLGAQRALAEAVARLLAEERRAHEGCRALRADLAAALAGCEAARAEAGRFSALKAELASERQAAAAALAERDQALAAVARARAGGALRSADAEASSPCAQRLAAARGRARRAEEARGAAQARLRAARGGTAACRARLGEFRVQEDGARGRAAEAAGREGMAGAAVRFAEAELELARSQLAAALGARAPAAAARGAARRRCRAAALLLGRLALAASPPQWPAGLPGGR